MVKKRRTVKAAMSAEKFYTWKFPDVKAGEVKVAPQRGNYTVFIGLSDGTIAYQWCESKAKAMSEAKYARNTVKKYGSDAPYWTAEGYKIYNPKANASTSTKRRFTVTASSKRRSVKAASGDMKRWLSTELPRDMAWKFKVWLRDNGIKFEPSEADNLIHFECYMSKDEADRANDYIDSIDNGVSASTTPKRKFTVKAASAKHRSIQSATIEDWGDGPVKVFWKSGKWSIIMDGYGLGITDGWGVDRPIIYTHNDPPTVAYDGTTISVPPYVKRKFEELVRKGVLKNRSDLYESDEWDTYFNAATSSENITCTEKTDTFVVYNHGNFVSSGGYDALRGGLYDIVSVDEGAKRACIDYCNSFGDPLIEESASAQEVADTTTEVIASEYDDALGAEDFAVYIGDRNNGANIEIFDKILAGVNASTSVKCSEGDGEFHLYGYDEDGMDVDTRYTRSASGIADAVDELFSYDEVDTVDIYSGMSGDSEFIGTVTREEHDNDSAGRVRELMDMNGIESASDVKCAVDLDDIKFFVKSYYGFNGDPFGGLADDITTDDWSEVESWSHEHLMKGESVKIDGPQGVLEITADEYNQAWEDGAADFDINEEIVDYKRRIVESSTAIKCSDDVVDLDSIYDDVTNWQQSADELASWDQASMKRELMSIFNDDTVKTSDGNTISIDELAEMYTGAAHRLARELKSDIESSDDIKCAYRDDTIDKEAVRELVLVITNDGDLYRQRTTPMIENLKKKVAKGVYDREKAVKLWQYLADEGVRRYDKDFGSGRGSVSMLNPATRRAIAEELRDYYEEQIMWDFNHQNDTDASTEITTL